MPYSTPTSPVASPVKEIPHSRKGFYTPPAVDDDMAGGPSALSGPMPGIPRRSSSSYSSGSTTPRNARSPPMSRQPSSTHRPFPSSRPLDGLPRRLSDGISPTNLTGLPRDGEGSLGLRLHPSPTKAPQMQRSPKDSMSSTSTIESSLPPTPRDELNELAVVQVETESAAIPFPSFDPPQKPLSAHHPLRNSIGNQRPVLGRRSASGLGHRGAGTGSLQLQLPASASTSHLATSPVGPPSRPTSMIRKKSGEVVKPSLKQRSMSTPDLTRQADSVPTSPEDDDRRPFGEERSKSVRFADTDDPESGALENVVLFLREQKVTAVGKAADPERAGTMTASETEDTDANDDFVHFRTRRNAAARLADEMQNIQLEGGSKVPRLRCDFSPDARGSLNGENVILERVELQNQSGPLTLKGSAIVRNLAFQKWVAVRFTLDNWQTTSEVTGAHVTHIPHSTTGDEGWDRFSFSIKLEDYKRKLDERQLVMCIRFSIEGREWWDSNDGKNYNFGFSKAAPRRSRVTGPSALGGGFMRLNEPAAAVNLPGLRQGRSGSPSSQIHKDFGAEKSLPTGPRNWVFPKLAASVADGPESRPDSPVLSPPPAAFFRPPPPPDAHTHLSLSKYCAPSPPQSPPKEVATFSAAPGKPLPSSSNEVQVIGGQLATLSPPVPTHERRSSWSGNAEPWESFSQAMESSEEATVGSTDGDSTPVAQGSRSPDISGDSSPEHKPLTMKRSTGDLRALIADDAGLITPPSSNLSSPPSPSPGDLLGEPMSPSPSAASTGESSPINTISSDSTPDLASIHIEVDPAQPQRGRSPNSYKMLSNSYQEFLDKFCFFQSPRATPNEEPTYTRPSYIPLSGHASPNGFPFYAGHSNDSPRNTPTPTPTRGYESANDAFGFHAAQSQEVRNPDEDDENSFGTTPTTPKASHKPPIVGASVGPVGYPTWGRVVAHDATPPAVTAAK